MNEEHLTTYEITKRPATKWGLLHDFSIGHDNQDWTSNCGECHRQGKSDVSDCNKAVIREHVRPDMRLIVEIGVCIRSFNESSTKVLIESMAPECTYYGLDVSDRSSVLPRKDNVKFLQGDSLKVEENIAKLMEGHDYIDLLFIDGNHSVNFLLNDWRYAEFVRPKTGVVMLHDTNYHPGPWCLMESVDPNLFDIERHCVEKDDFGIGVLKRR